MQYLGALAVIAFGTNPRWATEDPATPPAGYRRVAVICLDGTYGLAQDVTEPVEYAPLWNALDQGGVQDALLFDLPEDAIALCPDLGKAHLSRAELDKAFADKDTPTFAAFATYRLGQPLPEGTEEGVPYFSDPEDNGDVTLRYVHEQGHVALGLSLNQNSFGHTAVPEGSSLRLMGRYVLNVVRPLFATLMEAFPENEQPFISADHSRYGNTIGDIHVDLHGGSLTLKPEAFSDAKALKEAVEEAKRTQWNPEP